VKRVTVNQHPLIQHNVAQLRDKRTKPKDFRRLVGETAALMLFDATRDFALKPIRVITPLAITTGSQLRRPVLLVPILRAGLGLVNAILQILPEAHVGMVGIKRDEVTAKPSIYQVSLPKNLSRYEVILLDPMLATGGSALAALDLLTERKAVHLRMVNLLAAPEGIAAVRARYPRLPMFTAAIDTRLDARSFIVPGLGDAGDRMFGV
jgi:uracil phosphoribosyltransferase